MVRIQNKLGTIILSEDFLNNLAGYAATNCFGVVGMAARSAKDGIISVLNKNYLSRGVKVRGDVNGIDVDLHIVVTYGCNISAIVKSIAHNVRYMIEESCEIPVRDINIFVDGMKA